MRAVPKRGSYGSYRLPRRAKQKPYSFCTGLAAGKHAMVTRVTTFEVDQRTADLIAHLRDAFGVKTNAAVIRKVLALANVASQHADSDHTITISGGEKPPVKVSLAG